jgi:Zn-dependent protease
MSVLLGWPIFTAMGFQYLFVWVVCVFVSVLVHEFGHVLVGRYYGAHGHILLYSFGGLAIGSSALSNRWKRIAVSFAGPVAGFLLLAAVLVLVRDGIYFQWDVTPWPLFSGLPNLAPIANAAVGFLIWINLAWGLLNLLPIWPLDGGQISKDFLEWISPESGVKAAYVISIVVAGFLALNAIAAQGNGPIISWLPGGWWTAILFGSLAFNSFQALQAERSRPPWEQNRDW